jgi:hypothetical protein
MNWDRIWGDVLKDLNKIKSSISEHSEHVYMEDKYTIDHFKYPIVE